MIEFRLDLLGHTSIASVKDHLSEFRDKSVYVVRSRLEGGGFRGDEMERIALLRMVSDIGPALVDVELRSLEGNRSVSPEDFGPRIVVSWHDIERTPGLSTLHSVMRRAAGFGGLTKIVCTANDPADNLRALSLYGGPGPAPISFCMGELGVFSRVMAFALGCPMGYASLPGEAVAPGQISVDELTAVRRRLMDD